MCTVYTARIDSAILNKKIDVIRVINLHSVHLIQYFTNDTK